MADKKGKPHKFASSDPEKRAKQLANLNPAAAVKHNGFSRSGKDWFTEDEQALYEEVLQGLSEQTGITKESNYANWLLLERAAKSYVGARRSDQYEVKYNREVPFRATDFDAQFLKYLKSIKDLPLDKEGQQVRIKAFVDLFMDDEDEDQEDE